MQYAAQNLIPSTVELGGKSPNIFFNDVMAHDDEFLDKAVEGLVLYAFNKGEVCTCPSRALIQADIYDEFMARCLDRIAAIKQGNPLDTDTHARPAGLARSRSTRSRPTSRSAATRAPRCSSAAARRRSDGEFADGYYFEPTVLKGDNKMRVFQEEIFGPVLAVTTFTDDADALAIANDTLYGLGAGVWTRDGNRAYTDGPRHQGRPGLDELLPPVPGGRSVRRLQDLRHRPGEPPDDARPLQPDQEPARQLQHQATRPVLRHLMSQTAAPARITATPAARQAIARLRAARGGPVMFIQSGGCCAGSTPMCYPDGEFLIGDIDVLLGDIDGCPFYIDRRLDAGLAPGAVHPRRRRRRPRGLLPTRRGQPALRHPLTILRGTHRPGRTTDLNRSNPTLRHDYRMHVRHEGRRRHRRPRTHRALIPGPAPAWD